MLLIFHFAVGSMVSAFSAASSTTPRSFKLIMGMMFREMLFCFIGSFIYSIVATVALKNGYYGIAGNFTLFIFTLLFFPCNYFLRWVERISRWDDGAYH
jgi:uncharacterized membrane protein